MMCHHMLLLLLLAPLGVALGEPPDDADTARALLSDRFLRQVAELGLWSGTAACSRSGDPAWQGGYGWASRELAAPMPPDLAMPVGSNTKLFTAVAVMQLQRQGLLNVSDPASAYFDPEEYPVLGGKPWCPRLDAGAPGAPCEPVTISHLLSHASGLPDALSCTGAHPDSVPPEMLPYCIAAMPTNYSHVINEVVGATPAVWEMANWTLGMPLFSEPGSSFFYSNPGYWLLTAIVEKVSNASLGEYFEANIFVPLGLNATFYDTTNGAAGIHPAALTNAGYVTTWTTASGGRSGAALDWAQGAATWALGVSDAPHYEGLNALTLGAGAVSSSARDMHTWYRALFDDPERLGLTQEDVEEIIYPRSHVDANATSSYGYGVVVAEVGENATVVGHAGGIFNFRSTPYIGLHADGSQPLCVLLGNTHAALKFADAAAEETFAAKCAEAPSTQQLLDSLAAADPGPVSDMGGAEREAALLAHLCQIQALQGQSAAYVQQVINQGVWGVF